MTSIASPSHAGTRNVTSDDNNNNNDNNNDDNKHDDRHDDGDDAHGCHATPSAAVVRQLRSDVQAALQQPASAELLQLIADNNGYDVAELAARPHEVTSLELFLLTLPRVPTLRLFPCLTVLKLMHVGLDSMLDVATLTLLRELWLSDNCLRRIEGLQRLTRLRRLYLHNNAIASMDGLPVLPRLRVLWLCRNALTHLDNLHTLPRLRSLSVADNPISTLHGAFASTPSCAAATTTTATTSKQHDKHHLQPRMLCHLREVNVACCQLHSVRDLDALATLPRLRRLWLRDALYGSNALAQLDNYTTLTLQRLPRLRMLDGVAVTRERRAAAAQTTAVKRLYYRTRMAALTRHVAVLQHACVAAAAARSATTTLRADAALHECLAHVDAHVIEHTLYGRCYSDRNSNNNNKGSNDNDGSSSTSSPRLPHIACHATSTTHNKSNSSSDGDSCNNNATAAVPCATTTPMLLPSLQQSSPLSPRPAAAAVVTTRPSSSPPLTTWRAVRDDLSRAIGTRQVEWQRSAQRLATAVAHTTLLQQRHAERLEAEYTSGGNIHLEEMLVTTCDAAATTTTTATTRDEAALCVAHATAFLQARFARDAYARYFPHVSGVRVCRVARLVNRGARLRFDACVRARAVQVHDDTILCSSNSNNSNNSKEGYAAPAATSAHSGVAVAGGGSNTPRHRLVCLLSAVPPTRATQEALLSHMLVCGAEPPHSEASPLFAYAQQHHHHNNSNNNNNNNRNNNSNSHNAGVRVYMPCAAEGLPLTNSLYLADEARLRACRRRGVWDGVHASGDALCGQVIVSRVFLGKTVMALGGSTAACTRSGAPCRARHAHGDDSFMCNAGRRVLLRDYATDVTAVYRIWPGHVEHNNNNSCNNNNNNNNNSCTTAARAATAADGTGRVWHCLDRALVLPELVIDYAYTLTTPLLVTPALTLLSMPARMWQEAVRRLPHLAVRACYVDANNNNNSNNNNSNNNNNNSNNNNNNNNNDNSEVSEDEACCAWRDLRLVAYPLLAFLHACNDDADVPLDHVARAETVAVLQSARALLRPSPHDDTVATRTDADAEDDNNNDSDTSTCRERWLTAELVAAYAAATVSCSGSSSHDDNNSNTTHVVAADGRTASHSPHHASTSMSASLTTTTAAPSPRVDAHRLSYCSLHHCGLTSVPAQFATDAFASLTRLDLGHNALHTLSWSSLAHTAPQLQTLVLRCNQLRRVHLASAASCVCTTTTTTTTTSRALLPHLTTLDLSYNALCELYDLCDVTRCCFPQLRCLDVRGNPMLSLQPQQSSSPSFMSQHDHSRCDDDDDAATRTSVPRRTNAEYVLASFVTPSAVTQLNGLALDASGDDDDDDNADALMTSTTTAVRGVATTTTWQALARVTRPPQSLVQWRRARSYVLYAADNNNNSNNGDSSTVFASTRVVPPMLWRVVCLAHARWRRDARTTRVIVDDEDDDSDVDADDDADEENTASDTTSSTSSDDDDGDGDDSDGACVPARVYEDALQCVLYAASLQRKQQQKQQQQQQQQRSDVSSTAATALCDEAALTRRDVRSLCYCDSLLCDAPWLAQLPQLRRLVLRGHNLTSLDVVAVYLTQLRVLDVHDNAIAALPDCSALPHLRYLDVSHNALTSLAGLTAAQQRTLRHLDASGNALTSLDGGTAGVALSRFTQLRALYVAHNALASLAPLASLQALPLLAALDVCGNPATTTTTMQLHHHDDDDDDDDTTAQLLQQQAATTCEARLYLIYHLPQLKVIDGVAVTANEVQLARHTHSGRVSDELLLSRTHVATHAWATLTQLDLSHCALRDVSAVTGATFASLEVLRLHHNALVSLDSVAVLPRLRALDVAYNRLHMQPQLPQTSPPPHENNNCSAAAATASAPSLGATLRRRLPALESLSLEGNHLVDVTALALHHLPRLCFLNVRNNDVATLERGVCAAALQLPALQELLLCQNKLRALPAYCLAGCPQLRVLAVDDNYLRSIAAVATLPRLTHLSARNNRLADANTLAHELQPAMTAAATATTSSSNNSNGSNMMTAAAAAVATSSSLPLRDVTFVGNAATRKAGYRALLVCTLPQLSVLDGTAVTHDERERAQMQLQAAAYAAPPNVYMDLGYLHEMNNNSNNNNNNNNNGNNNSNGNSNGGSRQRTMAAVTASAPATLSSSSLVTHQQQQQQQQQRKSSKLVRGGHGASTQTTLLHMSSPPQAPQLAPPTQAARGSAVLLPLAQTRLQGVNSSSSNSSSGNATTRVASNKLSAGNHLLLVRNNNNNNNNGSNGGRGAARVRDTRL